MLLKAGTRCNAPSYAQLALLIGIIAAAFAARWHKIGSYSLWSNEFLSVEVAAGHGYEHEELPLNVIIDSPSRYTDFADAGSYTDLFHSLRKTNHPPLYYCALRLWCQLWHSSSDTTVRSLSTIFSLLTIVLAFEALRIMFDVRTALWGAAMLAVAAPQIQLAQEARHYAMLVTMMSACVMLIARIQFLAPTRLCGLLLTLTVSGILLTHYLGYTILAAMIAYAIIAMRGPSRRVTLLALTGGTAVALAAWGQSMWIQYYSATQDISWLDEPTAGHWSRLLWRLVTMPMKFFVDPGPQPGASAAVSCVLLLLPLLFLRRRPGLLLFAMIMWMELLVLALSDGVTSRESTTFSRFVLPAATAGALACIIILTGLRTKLRTLAPAAVVASALITLPLSYDRSKPDWNAFAKDVDSECDPRGTLVFYSPDPYYGRFLALGLSHYSPHWQRPIVILTLTANPRLERRLSWARGVYTISFDTPPDQFLRGAVSRWATPFPFLGVCSAVRFPAPPPVMYAMRGRFTRRM